MKAVVTGSSGFIGRHLCLALEHTPGWEIVRVPHLASEAMWNAALADSDVVFHLAGVNRPPAPEDFARGNAELTERLCDTLAKTFSKARLVYTSSTQATLSNPYGLSKKKAETIIENWCLNSGGAAIVFRLHNVFGKWCRPNYNSVVATFCFNIAHNLPITINDPEKRLDLVYVDDVVTSLIDAATTALPARFCKFADVRPLHTVSVAELAETIHSFKASRTTLELPSFDVEFNRRLYATYLSYLDHGDFSYRLQKRSDPRGSLAEFMKSAHFGQIFVSRTNPGVTRGNHYHHTKTEKFMVLEGEAIIRFRALDSDAILEYRVSGQEFKVVDIPPGYTHSIENVGSGELVTLFWASEIFNPLAPDTQFLQV